MRETIFRGKRIDNQEWVYGSLIQCGITGKTYIFPSGNDANESQQVGQEGCLKIFTFEVIPETVGQYTGLKDMKGKEIYDGDIVVANLKYFDIKNEKCKVIFKEGSFGMQYGYCDDYFKSFSAWDDFEVIGSMHDNPELLGLGV